MGSARASRAATDALVRYAVSEECFRRGDGNYTRGRACSPLSLSILHTHGSLCYQFPRDETQSLTLMLETDDVAGTVRQAHPAF